MQDYRRLHVWARAHALGMEIYGRANRWGRGHGALVNQIRRAAMSVSTNITEGCGQQHATEFARYLQIALASATELDYQLLIAADLELLDPRTYERLQREVLEIRRMLAVLRQRVLAARHRDRTKPRSVDEHSTREH